MRQAAADGAAVAYLDMADEARSVAQQRPALGDISRAFELALTSGRAEAQRAVVDFQVAQPGDAVQVDQMRRADQTKIHQRHETLPASERARSIAELRQ